MLREGGNVDVDVAHHGVTVITRTSLTSAADDWRASIAFMEADATLLGLQWLGTRAEPVEV